MTVIAYRDGVLAADTMAVYGDLRRTTLKIHRVGPYAWAAGSGCLSLVNEMIAWIRAGCVVADFPRAQRTSDDWQPVLVLRAPAGSGASGLPVATLYERSPYPIDYGPVRQLAIGSGREIAEGAMWMGATAEQAVRAAIELSPSCGGDVQVVQLV